MAKREGFLEDLKSASGLQKQTRSHPGVHRRGGFNFWQRESQHPVDTELDLPGGGAIVGVSGNRVGPRDGPGGMGGARSVP